MEVGERLVELAAVKVGQPIRVRDWLGLLVRRRLRTGLLAPLSRRVGRLLGRVGRRLGRGRRIGIGRRLVSERVQQ